MSKPKYQNNFGVNAEDNNIILHKNHIVKKFTFIFFTLMCGLVYSQEPILIHYNFSFEKEYSYLTNDLNYFDINIYNSRGNKIYTKGFEKQEFVRDLYGGCLLADTVSAVIQPNNKYLVKTNYQLRNKGSDSALFYFEYPDSVDQIALEIYFDQSIVSKLDSNNFKENHYPDIRYDLNPNPRVVLLIKYIKKNPVMLRPCFFMSSMLNPRPMYILTNNSNSEIFTSGKGLQSYFYGDLYKLDSNNIFKHSFPGFFCGHFGVSDMLKPGETDQVVEGYVIGEPNKLDEGFYKFSVGYILIEDSSKSAVTYFSVMYSK